MRVRVRVEESCHNRVVKSQVKDALVTRQSGGIKPNSFFMAVCGEEKKTTFPLLLIIPQKKKINGSLTILVYICCVLVYIST